MVSFKISQGWFVYQLLLFSSFHWGRKWEFKQLISLIDGSWVEGGRDDGSCWIQISNPTVISTCMGIDVVEILSVSEVSPSPQKTVNSAPVARFIHTFSKLSQINTKDTDTYSKLQHIHKERGALSTNNSKKHK